MHIEKRFNVAGTHSLNKSIFNDDISNGPCSQLTVSHNGLSSAAQRQHRYHQTRRNINWNYKHKSTRLSNNTLLHRRTKENGGWKQGRSKILIDIPEKRKMKKLKRVRWNTKWKHLKKIIRMRLIKVEISEKWPKDNTHSEWSQLCNTWLKGKWLHNVIGE
jgi:hypothetical protein